MITAMASPYIPLQISIRSCRDVGGGQTDLALTDAQGLNFVGL
jgi:hypothetical protein